MLARRQPNVALQQTGGLWLLAALASVGVRPQLNSRVRPLTRFDHMISLSSLLQPRGLDLQRRIKLVRHFDKNWDVYDLERRDLLRFYQSFQSKPVFRDCDLLVAFLGMERKQARFHGVYEVTAEHTPGSFGVPVGLETFPDFGGPNHFYYDLEAMPGFEDLVKRVVIKWGDSPLAWHQWYSDREVLQVLPSGFVRPFPGFLDFVLTHQELKDVIENVDAHAEWHRALRSIAAVYLILDTQTGMQYVGSATGEGGVIARWASYADSGHGGNLRLRELLESHPGREVDFRFTLLQTFSKTLTRDEIIAYEALHKRKLGSRSFGLNAN